MLEHCHSTGQSEILRSPSDFELQGQSYTKLFKTCTAETVHIHEYCYIGGHQKAESQATQDIQTHRRSPSVQDPETHNSPSLYDRNPTQLPPTAPFLPFQTAIDRFFEGGDNTRIL
jgi:hypothetical protein